MTPRHAAASAGIATLPILLLLLMASLLAAAWAQRSVLNEIRSASLQLSHLVAFETAEAGLAWTQALLNSGQPVDDECRLSSAGTGSTFGSRLLQASTDSGADATLRLRDRGAAAATPVLICMRRENGWRCACPSDGTLAPAAGAEEATVALTTTPSFSVSLRDGASPGTIVVSVLGCSNAARPCIGGTAERSDAWAGVRHTLALLPAVATPPAAALTVRGAVNAPAGAALTLHNPDAASGGLAVHAGGAISVPALLTTSVAGAAAANDRIGGDAALAALSAEQLFQRHFGPPIGDWKRQPGVRQLRCEAAVDCSARLQERIEAEADVARIAVDGELRIAGPVQLGTPLRPVVLVVDGDLQLDGAVVIHGLVYARSLQWRGAAGDGSARLTGAAIVSDSFDTDGAPTLAYDAALVARLRSRAGTWVRIPGSWRDDG